MNRALLIGLATAIYIISFYTYIYMLSNGMLDPKQRRLMYYYITFSMTAICYIDLKNITKTEHHKTFNDIAWGSLFANFILNIFNHHGFFNSDGDNMFMWFNGLIFANTLIVLICMKRHGFFKN